MLNVERERVAARLGLRVSWLFVVAVGVAGAAAAALNASPERQPAGHSDETGSRWWAHVQALADDSTEGRNTGSAGHRRAADYVATEFGKAGLEPAGTNGFIQPVAFKTRRILENQSSLALVRDGRVEPLVLGEDADIGVRNDPAPSLDAPLVFVGYGLRVPELSFDDLAGHDLSGAVAVYLSGSPSNIPGPLRAHYQSTGERWTALKQAGAVGTISIANPKSMDIPWARATLARLQPAMVLADPSLDDDRGQQLAVTMNPAHADKLFQGSGHTFAELLGLADAAQPLPRFGLPARIRTRVAVERSEVESQNVVGILRGTDPARRDEYVVLSAHLDHLGIGEPINGDRIYNGAMDNASGVAAILEVAHQLHETAAMVTAGATRGVGAVSTAGATTAAGATSGTGATSGPARSILLLAVTGEEKGLLGSRYFAAHPTVPASSIVANLNTDMFLPLFPLKTLMVLGLDESDLGRDVRAVAGQLGLGVQADPEPPRNRFIRSDQYSFIRAGVPALAMKVGYEPNTPEAEIAHKWTSERYHAPSDDLRQPVDLTAAGRFVDVLRTLAERIANRPDRPHWNESSFFKRFAQRSN